MLAFVGFRVPDIAPAPRAASAATAMHAHGPP